MQRRDLLKMMGASLVLWNTPLALRAANTNNNPPAKVVWVLLRGALDSLHTVVPTFDENLVALRPKLSAAIQGELLPLDRGFGLHPALVNMHQWYTQKQMMPIVAVSSGYQSRSHFDGQDFLESGKPNIDHSSGWLGRAINIRAKSAMAVSRATPISLRDADNVDTWFPSNLKDADEDVYSAIMKLYENDEALRASLESGLNAKNMMADDGKRKRGRFTDLAKGCATLMSSESGPDCGMLEMGGWDTHNNQIGRLNRQLSELDSGLELLKQGLGDAWQNTVVIIATEFGRTARENGTSGTDHGTASAMFLAGGRIKGGNVLGEWPGLADENLFKNRDLKPTSNSFAWIGGLLQQHWDMSADELADVFPQVRPYSESLLAT